MHARRHRKRGDISIIALCALSMLLACGGDSSDSNAADASSESLYTVSGSVTGLGGTLGLVLNGSELASLEVDGNFSFATPLQDTESYLVTVLAQPQDQLCTVASGSGLVEGANVSNVEVTCGLASAALASLTFSSANPLNPGFAPEQGGYALDVSLLTSEVSATATALDETATIRINGFEVSSGTTSAPMELNLGSNLVVVEVLTENGDSRTYFAEITRGSAVIQQIAYGKASNTGGGDSFGTAIAISGDTLAVGAPSEDSTATGIDGSQLSNTGTDSGAVYVFRRTGTTWTQEAYIKASNTEAGDLFGFSLALEGDLLAVGALDEDSNATGVDGNQGNNDAALSGAVYMFRRDGATWTQQAYLKASNSQFEDSFGASVSLAGDTLAVGARNEKSNATGVDGDQGNNDAGFSGAVYIFRGTGTAWAQEAYIKASNSGVSDNFGVSVTLSGDVLAVSAPGEGSNATGVGGSQNDNTKPRSGAVYVFRRSATTWVQEAFIKASNTDANDFFGVSISLSRDTLAIGANAEDGGGIGVGGDQGNSVSSSGAVYVFRNLGTTWVQEAYIKALNAGIGDAFGQSVALSGNTLAVGANLEGSTATGIGGDPTTDAALNSGAAYVFRRVGSNWTQGAYIKASNTDSGDGFGSSVTLSGDTLAVGAPFEDSNDIGIDSAQSDNNAPSSGSAYVFY